METKRQTLYIKNMVCPRCSQKVEQIFEDLGCVVLLVELGRAVVISGEILDQQEIEKQLKKHGFELLHSKNDRLVESVKVLLINLIYWSKEIHWPLALDEYIEGSLQTNFNEMDDLFYSTYRCTIQEYFNLLRFERAKELISSQKLSSQHIAKQLGYGNRQKLSHEFRQRLGLDLDGFIASENNYRISLDALV